MRSNSLIPNRPALREREVSRPAAPSARLSPVLVGAGVVVVASLIGWAAASLRGPHAPRTATSSELEAAPAPNEPRTLDTEPVQVTQVVAPRQPSPEVPHAANDPTSLRPSPSEEREKLVRDLASSGVQPAPWHRRAEHVLAEMTAKGQTMSAGPSWSKVDCFKRGCMADATYPNQQSFDQYDLEMIHDYQSPFHGWPGPKMRSPPVVQANGQVVATWALLSDEDDNQIKQ